MRAVVFALAWLGSPAHGMRLVASSPAVTETLFQLGKGRELVAASSMSDYPPEAKRLPSIGALYMPSIETVLKLRPDWVVSDASVANPLFTLGLDALHIARFTFTVKDVASLFSESRRFLETVYHERSNDFLDREKRCWEALPKRPPFRFLAFAWLSPSFLFGHASFLSDLITHTGGTNALPRKWDVAYPQVAEEWILAHPVDVVFFLEQLPGDEARAKAQIAKWWPGHSVELRGLPDADFARASFTPLAHLEALGSKAAAIAFHQCVKGRR